MIDLRCGRWEDVCADVEEVDCVLVDPPYSERTHAKQHHGRRDYDPMFSECWVSASGLEYARWGADDVAAFVSHWSPLCSGWLCVFTDSELYETWRDALREAGRYVFAPLACVQTGSNVRLAGDGPSNWTTWLVVARPRQGFPKWGTLPGAYIGTPFSEGENAFNRGLRVTGGKPLWLMRALVRDYSRPGQTICDPCAGGGTTLLAAAIEGRRAIGAEMDPETHAKATARIEAGWTPDMFSGVVERKLEGVQGDLL